MPENAKHHKIDRCIQEASDDYLKTVIVCPPDIYGQGYAVGRRTSFLVPMYVDALIKHKEAFYLGDGDNLRAVAHIDDVIEVFSLLVGEALKGGGEANWGNEVGSNYLRCSDKDIAANILDRGSTLRLLTKCAGRMPLWPSTALG